MIKIIAGNTLPNCKTLVLINLCKLLNDNGHECVLYGPDRWHLDKCKSGTIADFKPTKKDIIIISDINISSIYQLYYLKNYFNKKKYNPIKKLRHFIKKLFRFNKYKVHKLFLLNSPNSKYPDLNCPNPITDLKKSKTKPKKIAGIIDSICEENKIHLSIQKALKDKMDEIIIYGYMQDPVYFYQAVEPLLKKYSGKIKLAGFIDDQQIIYDSVSDIYNSSNSNFATQIQAECQLTNTKFHNDNLPKTRNFLNNKEIYKIWQKELNL